MTKPSQRQTLTLTQYSPSAADSLSICHALAPDARALLEAEARTEMRNLDGWDLVRERGELHLQKTYITADFLQAFALTERITRLAQAENHHPEITITWGSCRVSWWTTTLKGIHANDVLMAAATDEILYGRP
jgi:4a-hydroxytetrahydrobiopterin dehydratase